MADIDILVCIDSDKWLGRGGIIETRRYAHLAEGQRDELINLLAPARTPRWVPPRAA